MIKKFRLNIFDFIIIILIALCVVGVTMRAFTLEKLNESKLADTAEISFVIYGVDERLASALVAGDVYALTDSGLTVGVLKDNYTAENTVRYIQTEDGAVVTAQEDGLVDITGTFIAHGRQTEGGFLLGGEKKLYINGKYQVQSKKNSTEITVTQIAAKES